MRVVLGIEMSTQKMPAGHFVLESPNPFFGNLDSLAPERVSIRKFVLFPAMYSKALCTGDEQDQTTLSLSG